MVFKTDSRRPRLIERVVAHRTNSSLVARWSIHPERWNVRHVGSVFAVGRCMKLVVCYFAPCFSRIYFSIGQRTHPRVMADGLLGHKQDIRWLVVSSGLNTARRMQSSQAA